MDIIWDGGRLFVAGPDTVPNTAAGSGRFAVGVRFRPGAAPRFLGVPADELRDQRLDLDCFWNDASAIADRLAACVTLRDAAAVLENSIGRRLPDVDEPDSVVEAALRRWRRGAARADIAGLADGAAISERQLHRRFVRSVGYGPRLLHRVLRLQAFLDLCASSVEGLAEMAFRAGYADQAHLSRETRDLAGRTPAELRAVRCPVRNVQDFSPRSQVVLVTDALRKELL
jgi:AraC-like DNA-binding protein